MAMQIRNNVSWIGKIDWELRKFHGDDGLRCLWNPEAKSIESCVEYG